MSDFNWKIWAKKGLKKVAMAVVIGGLTELIAFLGTEPVPAEYVWMTAGGIVLIEMILNAIKHSS